MSYPLFLTVTTVTVTSSLFSLFPYQASKCPEQFVGHAAGIVLHVESRACVYRSEVRAVAAIVAAGNGDGLSHVDLRVALHLLLADSLHEGHLLVVVEVLAYHDMIGDCPLSSSFCQAFPWVSGTCPLTFCDSKKQEQDRSLLLLRLEIIGGTSPRF